MKLAYNVRDNYAPPTPPIPAFVSVPDTRCPLCHKGPDSSPEYSNISELAFSFEPSGSLLRRYSQRSRESRAKTRVVSNASEVTYITLPADDNDYDDDDNIYSTVLDVSMLETISKVGRFPSRRSRSSVKSSKIYYNIPTRHYSKRSTRRKILRQKSSRSRRSAASYVVLPDDSDNEYRHSLITLSRQNIVQNSDSRRNTTVYQNCPCNGADGDGPNTSCSQACETGYMSMELAHSSANHPMSEPQDTLKLDIESQKPTCKHQM